MLRKSVCHRVKKFRTKVYLRIIERLVHQSINKNVYSAPSRSLLRSAPEPGQAEKNSLQKLVKLPRQQTFRAMNGAHLASPIGGELGYAHWPQLGSQIHCPIWNQIWGPFGKDDVCPNFSLTVGKFVFSNSGGFRAKANPTKPRSCPKRPFGQYDCGPIPVLTGTRLAYLFQEI